MKIHLQKFIFKMFVLLLTNSLLFNQIAIAKTPKNNCKKEMNDFKAAYQALLDKYDYKDAANEKAADQYHKGKNFEAKLFGMYQNALRKVAKVYQANKKTPPSTTATSNDVLSSFFKQIEDYKNDKKLTLDGKIPQGKEKYETNISKIVDELVKQSKDSGEYAISADDAYMLKNLLVHSNDFICRTSWLAKDINELRKTKKYTEAQISEIVSIANSPLNRMVIALSAVTDTTNLTLVNDDANAIHASVETDLKILREKWNEIKINHKECIEKIKSSNTNFLQNDIQNCNYKKFLDSLDNSNISDLESILHFINANEQHRLNGYGALKTPKTQTGLDEKLLDSMIDNTFGKQKPTCVDVNGKKFIHNLEYENQKFKTDGIIVCKKEDDQTILSDADCSKFYELVVDSINGLGLEFKLKPQPKVKTKKGQRPKPQPKITVSFDSANTAGCSISQPPSEPPHIHQPPVQNPQTCIEPRALDASKNCVCPSDKPNYIEKDNKCLTEKEETDPEKECIARGRVWDKDSIPQCKKPAESDDRRRAPVDAANPYEYLNDLDDTVPARGNFVPIQIPTRQPYMLPGLP